MTRISRKAQDKADELTARINAEVRHMASELAASELKEFADEGHVKAAFKIVILMTSAAVQ